MDSRILIYNEKPYPIAAVTSYEAALAVSRLQGEKVLLCKSTGSQQDHSFESETLLRNGQILRQETSWFKTFLSILSP